jgi:hypothetical protein
VATNRHLPRSRAVQNPQLPMPAKPNLSSRFNLICPVRALHVSYHISDFQKLSLTLCPNHLLIPRHPVPEEGALAIVTDVGAGSDGRRCAFDEQRVRRTAKSCGPDAPMAGVKFERSKLLAGDGDKQALVSPGRARNKL